MRTAASLVVQETNRSRALRPFQDDGAIDFVSQNWALPDLLGDSVLNRLRTRLQRYGLQPTTDFEYSSLSDLSSLVERLLLEFSKEDVTTLVLIRLSAYAEIDYFDVLRFHREHGKPITAVHDSQGPLHISVLDVKQETQCAEFNRNLLNGSFWEGDEPICGRYIFEGYVNRLESPQDFCRLATDALAGRCELRPVGCEVIPGVWLGEGARIDAGARILAPVYIGRHTKIRNAAVISRASVERDCEVDCATVIDESNVLPFSYVGAGLKVANALVNGSGFLNLTHNVELQIRDQKLLGRVRSGSLLFSVKDSVGSLARSVRRAAQSVLVPTASSESFLSSDCPRNRAVVLSRLGEA